MSAAELDAPHDWARGGIRLTPETREALEERLRRFVLPECVQDAADVIERGRVRERLAPALPEERRLALIERRRARQRQFHQTREYRDYKRRWEKDRKDPAARRYRQCVALSIHAGGLRS